MPHKGLLEMEEHDGIGEDDIMGSFTGELDSNLEDVFDDDDPSSILMESIATPPRRPSLEESVGEWQREKIGVVHRKELIFQM